MQALSQHITKLVAIAAIVAACPSWMLNYVSQNKPVLGGEDRFTPIQEGYRD